MIRDSTSTSSPAAGPMLSRRRVFRVLAGAAGAGVLGPAARAEGDATVVWQGSAMGAEASMVLAGGERAAAEAAIRACRAEIERLENIFSLFRATSAISRLNRAGRLPTAPPELIQVLRLAAQIHRLSDGAFDVTVQPLWRLYADHFGAGRSGEPAPDDLALALRRTGQETRVRVDGGGVALAPATEITLNGIAQGYVADRVAALLRRRGWRHVLVDVGERVAFGRQAGGAPWRLRVGDRAVPLIDVAAASSAGDGYRFEPSGRFHHLLNPRTGDSARTVRAVTVTAPQAVLADALSTALAVMPPMTAPTILRQFPHVRAWIETADGDTRAIG